MLYSAARSHDPDDVVGWVQQGILKGQAGADEGLVQRMREGALQSPQTPRRIKRMVRNCPWKPEEVRQPDDLRPPADEPGDAQAGEEPDDQPMP